MPVPQAAQNLLMPHLRDWQGAQIPTVAGGGGGGEGADGIELMHNFSDRTVGHVDAP